MHDFAALRQRMVDNQIRTTVNLDAVSTPFAKHKNPLGTNPRIGLYKPFTSQQLGSLMAAVAAPQGA